ncbi:hypothetical protein M758_12G138900 [Ceratodon purpureus]|nr:hypothetical protein M758_12G138900 [Ceratodon purpureus]
MFSQLGCAEEDTEVDPQLGYPLVYPKLCRHAHSTGLPMPFLEGPPQRFLPYSPLADDFAHLKDWDNVFPVVAEKEKDSLNTRKFAEELWQQLDHLGNAGFDPAKFRVDPYGNVVYWNADPSSPLAWDIDYWFPHPRGGKTKLPNLRIVQWQAYLRKRNRLEFLVPWWDLQHGCSINQFLSAFAAKNADFRKRSFALFFAGGEDESVAREHVGECRPWPQQFREKKALCGLAAAAIVSVSTEIVEVDCEVGGPSKGPTSSDVSRILGAYPYGAILGTPSKRLWSIEEEEAVKRGVSKFGPGSWKEIKEDDVTLANRSVAQIKEKFRLMRGVSRNVARENGAGRGGLSGRQSAATTALQKELRVKIMREEDRREKEEELAQLEETVTKLKLENEKERLKAQELESLLKKHKHRVEKQRKWAESQSSYRLCLERVLRDTMHQTITYKEQARLTREACNVLIARLDSQKATCEAMEHELLQRHSQREILEAAAGGNMNDRTTLMHKKLVTQGRDVVDVSSCVSLRAGDDDEDEEEEKIVMTANKLSESDTDDEGDDEVYNLRREHQQAARKSLVRHAIKVAMQVEDTKETVDDLQWDIPSGVAKPPCPIQASKYMAQSRKGARKIEEVPRTHIQYDADSETQGSESDSDFADDEMSPAIRISREDNKLVSELSQFHEGPTSELRDFCTRNSKPGDSNLGNIMVDYAKFEHGQAPVSEPALDIPIPSAGESLRSDHSKQEVQKDVIMVQQTESNSKDNIATTDNPTLCKQEYIDELLQQIRFQIPTSEVTEEIMASGRPYMSEGHLDELLEQVLKTHLDNVRETDARQPHPTDVDDEKLKEIGKSNLDKWLQALLFKDAESVCSSPGHDTPALQITSPALSQLSMAAMRESLELASHKEFLNRDNENAERPRSSLWGALLRKLTVKHHDSELSLFEPKEDYDMIDEAQNMLPRLSNHEAGVADAMNSLLKSSPNNQPTEDNLHRNASSTLAEGRRCGNEPCTTLPGWPGGNPKMGVIALNYWPNNTTSTSTITITNNNTNNDNTNNNNDNNTNTNTEPNSLSNDSSTVWKTERRVEDGVQVDYPHSFEKRHFPRPLSDVDEISETESTDSPSCSITFPVAERKELHRHKRRVSIKVAGFVGWKKGSKRGESKVQCDEPPAQVATLMES